MTPRSYRDDELRSASRGDPEHYEIKVRATNGETRWLVISPDEFDAVRQALLANERQK